MLIDEMRWGAHAARRRGLDVVSGSGAIATAAARASSVTAVDLSARSVLPEIAAGSKAIGDALADMLTVPTARAIHLPDCSRRVPRVLRSGASPSDWPTIATPKPSPRAPCIGGRASPPSASLTPTAHSRR